MLQLHFSRFSRNFQISLNDEGKYTYKANFKNIEVIVDASGGHIASEKVQVTNIKHEDLKEHIKEENNQKYLKIFIGLGLIFLIFFLLKRFKK